MISRLQVHWYQEDPEKCTYLAGDQLYVACVKLGLLYTELIKLIARTSCNERQALLAVWHQDEGVCVYFS